MIDLFEEMISMMIELAYADVTQLARVTAFQAVGCEFESRRPLQKCLAVLRGFFVFSEKRQPTYL